MFVLPLLLEKKEKQDQIYEWLYILMEVVTIIRTRIKSFQLIVELDNKV